MPKKGKIRSINVSNKWKQWYIINKSKTSIVLSYHEFLFHIISLFILSIILCYLGKSLTYHDLPGPPKDHLLLSPCLVEPHLTDTHPTDRSYHFSLENKKNLNINIASFFLKTLASPNEKSGMTQEVQLHKQSITFLLILIIGGLLKIHGKQ